MQRFNLIAARRTQVALLLVTGVAVALITSAYVRDGLSARGESVPFGAILFVEVIQWSLWAAMVPAIVGLDRRFGVARLGWARGIALHLAAAVSIFLGINAVLTPLIRQFRLGYGSESLADIFTGRAQAKILDALAVYVVIVGVIWLIDLAADRYKQESRAARLEAALSDARFRLLQTQLQPHFLFNTLHTVSGLVRQKRDEAALNAIADLGELLRHSLRDAERPEVTLGEELEWLTRYLSLQRLRFGARLSVQQEIETGTLRALVPPFLLQPIVENAVLHGLGDQEGGSIVLRAWRNGNSLALEVEDSGRGVSADAVDGVGLRAIRERLQARFDGAATLTLHDAVPQGTIVRIVIPFVEHPST